MERINVRIIRGSSFVALKIYSTYFRAIGAFWTVVIIWSLVSIAIFDNATRTWTVYAEKDAKKDKWTIETTTGTTAQGNEVC